nr:MAG TPA: hypothetical protein [Caudoviricetes sp.]
MRRLWYQISAFLEMLLFLAATTRILALTWKAFSVGSIMRCLRF